MIDFKQALSFFGTKDKVSSTNSEVNFEGKTQKEIRDFKRDIANSKKQELTDDAFVPSEKGVTQPQRLELLKQKAHEIDREIDEVRDLLEDLPQDSPVRDKLQQKLTKLYEFGHKVLDEYEKLNKKGATRNEKITQRIKTVAGSIDEVRTVMSDLPKDSPVRNKLQAELDNLYKFYFELCKESVS